MTYIFKLMGQLLVLVTGTIGAPVTVASGLLLVGLMALVVRVPIRYNVRNLLARWRTTAMTALAFTLVIGLLTVMLAFVNGMYQLTENSGRPDNLIIIAAGNNDETFSNLAFTDVADVENQPGLARTEQGLPLCSKETFLIVNQPVANAAATRPPRGVWNRLGRLVTSLFGKNATAERPHRRFLQLRGIEDPAIAAQVHRVGLYPGGDWFSEAGVQAVADPGSDSASAPALIQAVLGEGVARVLGSDRGEEELAQARNPDRLDVGDTFSVGERRWLVVGVMRSTGLTFDSEIWARRDGVGKAFGKETYTSLVLTATSAAEAQRLKDFFAKDYGKATLQPLLEPEYYSGLSGTNKQFLVAIIFLAAVMSIGGVFGVMNTMFAAISQRTKDIGVMRLLGFSRRQMLLSFLLESLVIALVGGLVGCALGCLSDGWSASSIVGSGPGGGKSVVLQLTVNSQILACGMLLTLVMGFAGGLVPALLAMRLKPLESLR
ncbi:MAG: ABC transporter permease [Planctomycetota bacterium]|nr:ABC transporter permease [Planctomycetota bacterium]